MGEKEQTNISKKKIANIHKENYSTSEQVLPCKWSENKSIEWDFQSDNWEGLKWNVFICTFICSEMVKLGALLHTWKISKPTQILGVCLMKKPQFSVLVTERIPLHSFIRVHMECDAKNVASKRPLSLWNHKSRLLSDIQPRLISSTVLINSIALLTLSKVNAFVNMPQRSSSEHKRGREREKESGKGDDWRISVDCFSNLYKKAVNIRLQT